MLELPQGRVTERRRGGLGVLALLAADLSNSGADAYIRSERVPAEMHPRIGYVVFRNGLPLLAMHQADTSNHAVEALLEIENDAVELDCLLSVHRNIDVDLLVQTFSSSLLDLELETESSSASWWRNKSKSARSWTRIEATEEDVFALSQAEVHHRAVEAKLRRLSSGLTEELLPGYAHLVQTPDPTLTLDLASHFQNLRHPTLIISRKPVEQLGADHGLDAENCRWLTESHTQDDSIIEPQLETIYMVLKNHLDNNERSILVIDGFEFLHAIHGFDRAIDFLRRLADIATTSDDLTFIPIDLEVFDDRQQALISRELDELDTELLESWLTSPEDLEGHRFHLPDLEEEQWEEQLQAKSLELALAAEALSSAGPSLAELVDAAPTVQEKINPKVNRLNLSSIIDDIEVEEMTEEQMAGVVQFKISEIEEPSEQPPVQPRVPDVIEHRTSKGPRKPVVVKRAPKKDIRASRQQPSSRGSSGLDQVTRILDARDEDSSSESEKSKQDRERTYRQYYDTSQHKSA